MLLIFSLPSSLQSNNIQFIKKINHRQVHSAEMLMWQETSITQQLQVRFAGILRHTTRGQCLENGDLLISKKRWGHRAALVPFYLRNCTFTWTRASSWVGVFIKCELRGKSNSPYVTTIDSNVVWLQPISTVHSLDRMQRPHQQIRGKLSQALGSWPLRQSNSKTDMEIYRFSIFQFSIFLPNISQIEN